MFRKLINLFEVFYINKAEREFINFNKSHWKNHNKTNPNNGQLLIEVQRYHPNLFKSAFIANAIADELNLSIKTALPLWGGNTDFIFKNFYPQTAIKKIADSFNAKEGLSFTKISLEQKKKYYATALKLWRKLKSKQDLLELKYEGILIGDLVYCSYLSRFKSATVDIHNRKLITIIQGALEIHHACINYVATNNVKCLLIYHAVYIQHGILVRLALKHNINVIIISNYGKFGIRKLTSDYYVQTANHHLYREDFKKLSDKSACLEQGHIALKNRFSGIIDNGTKYMQQSAYANIGKYKEPVLKKTRNQRVIIFLHCFFDSPHIYKWMLFPDFYEWLNFTLDTLSKTNHDIYIKPHPNGRDGNDEIIQSFIEKYPSVNYIEKTVSNVQLINEGFNAAVTVYGTLGHEFPYFNIPVIAAGDNPQATYSFCNTPKSLEEYESHLLNISQLNKSFDKNEIAEFYYMHYIHQPSVSKLSKEDLINFFERTKLNEPTNTILNKLLSRAKNGEFDHIGSFIKSSLKTLM